MKRFPLISIIILAVVNVSFLFLPLISVFGYEFSLFNSLLVTILSGVFAIRTMIYCRSEGRRKTLKELVKGLIILLLVPFIISLINSFFTGFCSFSNGLLFYFTFVFPAVIIGSAFGAAALLLWERHKYIVYTLLLFAVASITLYEIYFNPQNFFYSPLFVYFSGTIYDEGLSVDLKLIFYRSANLFYFGILFFAAFFLWYKKATLKKRILLIAPFVLTAGCFVALSPYLGYSSTVRSLSNELDYRIETENFVIHFDPRVSDDEKELIALHHEYYYTELKKYFNEDVKQKIESFIFFDRKQKKNLFGAENADVAKPWLRQLYTTKDNFNSTLRHEIAHCFTSNFGGKIFKVAEWFNPSLIEGIAMAADPFYDDNYIDYVAALAFKNGYKINIRTLFEGLNFFSQNSSISYIYAGSFVKFLVDNYGIDKFKLLYTDIDFEKYYGKKLSFLIEDYKSYLSTWEADNKNEADYYFGRKSIFAKVCPRFIADQLTEAWDFFNEKKYNKAGEMFADVLKMSDNYSALTGLAAVFSQSGRKDSAIYLLKKNLNSYPGTAYFFNLQFQLADLYVVASNYSIADSIYSALQLENPNRTISNLSSMRIALKDFDTLLTIYVNGKNIDKYLILRQLNSKSYNYNSIPSVINLSEVLEENYNVFLKQFDKTLIVNSEASAYAVYKLSEYALKNLDYMRARRLAALSTRYKAEKNFSYIAQEQLKKSDWFYKNFYIKNNFITNK